MLQPLPIRRAAGDGLAHLRDVRLQGDPTRLLGAERVEHRLRCGVRLAALGNRLGEPLLTGADEAELLLQRQPALGPVPVRLLQAPECLRNGGGHHMGVEPGRHGLEDGRVQDCLWEMEVVATYGGAPLRVVGTPVEVPPAPPVVATHGDEGATAGAAAEPAQEVGGGLIEARRCGARRPGGEARYEGAAALCQLGVGGRPEFVRDDAQRGDLGRDDVLGRPLPLPSRAPAVDLLGAVPSDHPPVVFAEEHLPDGRVGPAGAAWARRSDVLGIQGLGHAGEAPARRTALEELTHHGGLLRIDLPRDVLPLGTAVGPGSGHLDVVVTVDAPAGDVPGARLAEEGIMGALLRALPLELARVAGDGEQDLIGGRVEGALAVLEVVEDADAGIEDLLEGVAGLDGLAPQPGLLGHDQHLERGVGLERVHQPEEARALDELGPADAVIDVDAVLAHEPAMLRGVLAGVLDLAGDGALLVTDPGLVGRLPPIDGREQGTQDLAEPAPRPTDTDAHAGPWAPPPSASSASARSHRKASASAETTAVKTGRGQKRDGSSDGLAAGRRPRCQVLTRPR